jgi:DeoR/GlpR family transcriptional regulator of sugar metabolism
MMQQSDSSILVADATKFDKTSFVHMADFNEFDLLITDRELNSEWITTLRENDVEYQFGPSLEKLS